MEKNHNPNSWSELPLELLSLVFERLSYANFQRAKSVCSSWYSAWRQSVPNKNQLPWLILFPEDKDNNKNSSCMLFNPEEKDKLYKTQDLGVEFAKSVCIATYGSWLLMQDPRYNLYIMNIFTRERIDLPSVERTIDDWFRISNDYVKRVYKGMEIRSPVFWIDEKTKDYVVIWGLRGFLVYSKKGDKLWNRIREISYGNEDMVYKDHKLYFFSYFSIFKIYNFSGDIPREIIQLDDVSRFHTEKIVVTITGDVLAVEGFIRNQSFRIRKIYSSDSFGKHDKVDSLGDQAMFWDLGITVIANEVEGLNRNSIYFSDSHDENTKDLFLFNFETRKTEQLYKFDFDYSLLDLSSRWFLPSFTHT